MMRRCFLFPVFFLPLVFLPAEEPKKPTPLSPDDEKKTFQLAKGFRIDLVASEPDIVDPVAMCFDERGRMFVAEMRGYPNGGIAKGDETRGRIRMLIDEDGDGRFDKSTIFAEGLRFPTSVMPWKGGLLVANCPDLIYLQDTKDEGKADKQTVLYTGFGLDNIQQLLNGFQWGLDNWIYGMGGNNGGTIRSLEKSDAPAVVLRGQGIRFRPDRSASLESTSGGGQYGLTCDDFQHYFTATNSQHLRQIVLPEPYLKRNPFLAVPAVTVDIPEHGAACKVFRISPYEAWRVERTTRRKDGPEAKRLPATELVPGGYITSACSPLIYTDELFPAEFRGNNFVCDPANNLIHRETIDYTGPKFVAKRVDMDREFLASTDTCFRPVALTLGPDGAIYILDFYREAIETPLSLPDDIKRKMNLESAGRGRIWRIAPEGFKPPRKINLHEADAITLSKTLDSPNSFLRMTAQRLLIEKTDLKAVPQLKKLATEGSAAGRVHAMWSLHGLGKLEADFVRENLKHASPGVREQALRLAEDFLDHNELMCKEVVKLVEDPSPQVRFQLAFSLGASKHADCATALAAILLHSEGDIFTQTAALSSAGESAPALLAALLKDEAVRRQPTTHQLALMRLLAETVGARGDERADRIVLDAMVSLPAASFEKAATALLQGLGKGSQNTRLPLPELWKRIAKDDPAFLQKVRAFFETAGATAADDKKPIDRRAEAIVLLGLAPFDVGGPVLAKLLVPQIPTELQVAVVRTLSPRTETQIADLLLAEWKQQSPEVRRVVLEAILSRPERVGKLLVAIEKGKVQAGQLGVDRIEQLRRHPDAALREKALKLVGQVSSDRKKVVDAYRKALELTGDSMKGKALFKKNCAVCHRLENEGVEVGADLKGALKNKSREALLFDILDPNKEVDPRYVNYLLNTTGGLTMTGILAVDTATSITLRRAEKQEDTVLRSQIESLIATGKSLMPEEFEKELSRQDLCDLIEYLLNVK